MGIKNYRGLELDGWQVSGEQRKETGEKDQEWTLRQVQTDQQEVVSKIQENNFWNGEPWARSNGGVNRPLNQVIEVEMQSNEVKGYDKVMNISVRFKSKKKVSMIKTYSRGKQGESWEVTGILVL